MRALHYFAALLLLLPIARADDLWPMRFVAEGATTSRAVVLHKEGRAEYRSRETRSDGTEYRFEARIASWRICPNTPADARPLCISVDVEGDDGDPTPARYRFDYWLSGATLTEFDKTGTQAVLKR